MHSPYCSRINNRVPLFELYTKRTRSVAVGAQLASDGCLAVNEWVDRFRLRRRLVKSLLIVAPSNRGCTAIS